MAKKAGMVKKTKDNKKLLIPIAIALIAIIAVAAFYLTRDADDTSQVATVNGEPVYAREVEFRMVMGRGRVINYFRQKYNAETNSKFWTSTFGDENPMEYARKMAFDESIRIKIQQIVAKQKGLIDDIDYLNFLENLEEENRVRKEAIEKGQIVQGLQQYGESDHFDRVFRSPIEQSKDKLLEENEIEITEDELRGFYDEHKEEYKKQDYLKIQRIYVPFSLNDESSKNLARQKIDRIKERIDKGEQFEDLMQAAKDDSLDNAEYQELVIDENTEIIDIENILIVRDTAEKNPINQVSDVLEALDSYNIIRCVEKKDSGYRSYDDMKSLIKAVILSQKYDDYIDNLVKTADLKTDEEVYKKIKLDKQFTIF